MSSRSNSLKYFLFLLNLQLERAQKYIKFFLAVTFAFTITICALSVHHAGDKTSEIAFAAYLTLIIWCIVNLFSFLIEVDFTDVKVLACALGPIYALAVYLCSGVVFCYIKYGPSRETIVHLFGAGCVSFVLLLAFSVILCQLIEYPLSAWHFTFAIVMQYVALVDLYYFISASRVAYEWIQGGNFTLT